MEMAYEKACINPQGDLYLCGYLNRKGKSNGLLNDIYVHTLVIDKVIIISIETLIITRTFTKLIRTLLGKDYPDYNIMISATHTHAAPAIDDYIWFEAVNKEYQILVIEKIKQTIKACINNLSKVNISYGTKNYDGVGKSRLGKDIKGNIKLNLIIFKDENKQVLLNLINYNTHPTVLNESNLLVSGDYLSDMMDYLNKETKQNNMFLQGPCGDISTRYTRIDNDLYCEKKRLGKLLAQEVIELGKKCKDINSNEITLKQTNLKIDFKIIDKRIIESKIDQIEVKDDFSKNQYLGYQVYLEMLKHCNKVEDKIELNLLKIDSLKIFFVAGEPYSSIYDLKDNNELMIVAYSNGYPGYIYDQVIKDSYEEVSSLLKANTLDLIKEQLQLWIDEDK